MSDICAKKKMAIEKFFIVNIVVCTVVVTFGHLGFGIANAVVSSQTTSAKNECDEVWYCTVALAVLSLLVFVNGVWKLLKFSCDLDLNLSEERGTNWFSFAHLAVSIWAIVIYFDASENCSDLYQSNWPMLWNMLLANVVFTFVCFGIIVWLFVCTCCVLICSEELGFSPQFRGEVIPQVQIQA